MGNRIIKIKFIFSDILHHIIVSENFRYLVIFIAVFIYSLMAMTLIRDLYINNVFGRKDGILPADPYYYYNIALKQVEFIRSAGIRGFQMFPSGQGVAGVTSVILAFGGGEIWIILVNALLHAGSVVVMIAILRVWFSPGVSVIAVIPLAFSPYMMIWFSQINKESYALFGSLIILYGLINILLISGESIFERLIKESILVLFGSIFLWVVRPYLNRILLPVVLACLIIACGRSVVFNRFRIQTCVAWVCVIFFVIGGIFILRSSAASDRTIDALYSLQSQTSPLPMEGEGKNSLAADCAKRVDFESWENSRFLFDFINRSLQAISGQRCLVFTIMDRDDNVNTLNSIVDKDVLLGSSLEAILYMPRAFVLGVFSPFPNSWFYIFNDHFSFFYLISSIESLIFYIGLIGLIFWAVLEDKKGLTVPVLFSLWPMFIYGMATPYLGALYRYRFPYWSILICFGIAASVTLVSARSRWFCKPFRAVDDRS